MKPSQRLRGRILKHLLVGGAVASTTGCIVKDEFIMEDAQVDEGLGITRDAGPRPVDAGPRPVDVGPRPVDVGPRPVDVGLPTIYPPSPTACTLDCCVFAELSRSAQGDCASSDDPEIWEAYEEGGIWLECCSEACCDFSVSGPYESDDSSTCAYLLEAIVTCMEGRPFYVAQENRTAPTIPRADWL